jgi:hypothetical protein
MFKEFLRSRITDTTDTKLAIQVVDVGNGSGR